MNDRLSVVTAVCGTVQIVQIVLKVQIAQIVQIQQPVAFSYGCYHMAYS